MNPYRGTTLFGFFAELVARIWGFLSGTLHFSDLASDEVQLLVLGSLAISGALVGTFLVLRRMVMLANSLSHTILLGIVVTYLAFKSTSGTPGVLDLPVLIVASLVTALVTTFLTALLSRRLQEDAAIGLVFTTLFALGLLLVTLFTRNVHIGTEVIMGNADALHPKDLKLAGAILLGNLALTALFLRFYRVTSFDPAFARSLGFSMTLGNYLLMTQVSATAIGGFRAVGVMMVLAFFVAPTLAARQLTNRLGLLLVISSAIGLIAALLGVATARHLLSVYQMPISTSGLVVCYLVLLFGGSLLLRALARWRAPVAPPLPEPAEQQAD